MLASILQVVFYTLLALTMFGDAICSTFGVPCPDALKSLQENKLMYAIGGFFIFAQISTSLRSTGAFEVSINDELVWSKLETGRNIDAGTLNSIFEPYGVSFIQ